MNMKYLEQYIEEKIKIKVLGELTTRECCEAMGWACHWSLMDTNQVSKSGMQTIQIGWKRN